MSLNPRKTVLLVCDVQERFRSAIYGFEPLTASICKLVKASQVLGISNYVTEQNPRALGPTVQEITSLLDESPDEKLNLGRFSKTKFSMITDEIFEDDIGLPRYKNFILTGIESHICITQTALDALKITEAENIYIPVDAVSSCNKEEVPIALDNLRQRGVQITTSESLLYRLLGDADHPQFKYIAKLVREEKQNTAEALQTLAAVL